MIDEDRVRTLVRRVVLRTLGVEEEGCTDRSRKLVTQLDLQDVRPGREFAVPEGAIVTPLARQTAMERRISLVPRTAPAPPAVAKRATNSGAPRSKTIAIGADHGGFKLKETLRAQLEQLGYGVIDCGTDSDESVDYPDFALAVAELVADGRAWRGVVVDGAGIGSCMAANKVPGVRAAMCYDEATALNSREHNHATVLTLGAGMINAKVARTVLTAWLEAPDGGGRHARRVDKITDIEKRFSRKG